MGQRGPMGSGFLCGGSEKGWDLGEISPQLHDP